MCVLRPTPRQRGPSSSADQGRHRLQCHLRQGDGRGDRQHPGLIMSITACSRMRMRNDCVLGLMSALPIIKMIVYCSDIPPGRQQPAPHLPKPCQERARVEHRGDRG